MTLDFPPHWYASPLALIAITWILWALSWIAASIWTGRTIARAGVGELPSLVLSAAGFYLVLAPGRAFSFGPEWTLSPPLAWAMLTIVVAGAAFAWWGRAHLGTLWSGRVTRKENHRVVDTGPYAIVRHPIYTGLISAAFATAIARGNTHSLVGAILLMIGFWLKARLEEKFLSVGLGPEYETYRNRVPMLAPLIRMSNK